MNTVDEVLKYLYSLQQRGIKLGLDRVYEFQELLEYPDRSYQTIHVAGTNGKGSVVWFVAEMLESIGLKVGKYTSPHLIKFNERVSINGRNISDAAIVEFVKKWRQVVDELGLTFFETTTLMTMDYFRQQQIDVAVLETGLGGRLDATNIVSPMVTIITSIGLDHTNVLGDSISQVAREKAGIMKPGVQCIHGYLPEEAQGVLRAHGELVGAKIVDAFEELDPTDMTLSTDMTKFTVAANRQKYHFTLSMLGEQAVTNATISLAAIENQNRYDIPWDARQQALSETTVPGRLDLLNTSPLIYYDVAHNYDGIRNLVRNMQTLFPGKRFRFLLNLHIDKDINGFDEIFPDTAVIGLLDIGDGSMHEPDTWKQLLGQEKVRYFGTGEKAIRDFILTVGSEEVGVITGSHYLAEAINRVWKFLLDR